MAVGLGPLPVFHQIAGVRIGTASAGIKKPGRKDLVLFELAEGCKTAATFTQNQFCAAPVQLAKGHLSALQEQQAGPRYLLINTGNANAGTGAQGLEDARICCAALGGLAGVSSQQVLPFSTGVIGEPLPVTRITTALPAALEALAAHGWADAAEGIMTTDTLPKGATESLLIDGQLVHISGISKGAGMICPNMATMLAFVATDAAIDQAHLQQLLTAAVAGSFNRITVDGDTSTNDACVLVATGHSRAPALTPGSAAFQQFAEALQRVMLTLAQAIVRDAEGATKFVTVQVQHAASQQDALAVAYAVAHSPLVKTALFAADPNWGRILAAVGRSGVADLKINALRIALNGVSIVRNGGRDPDYTEAQGQAAMAQAELVIGIDLADGDVQESVWTSDLSHDYVTINAEYRT